MSGQDLKDAPHSGNVMGLGYSLLVRPLLALMDSEKAHGRALFGLKIASFTVLGRLILRVLYKPRHVESNCLGMNFANPLGLAAGMDKKAEAMRGWETLGFGFIEVGGVTEHEQSGNPKPRMFRSSKHSALVNRMGFNNPGSEKMATRLAKASKPNIPLLLNVGKSRTTNLEDAHLDYARTVERCGPYVDGFVINVSSPNTPNLRELQKDEDLARIIKAVQVYSADKPVLIKISPDLEDMQIRSVVDTARHQGCAGIIATNTTTNRPEEEGVMLETGGLSGKPLRSRSTKVIRLIADHTDGQWPIIGVGGISNADDAWEKIINGASLIQVYSAMVFQGASVVKDIVNGLDKKLKAEGLDNLEQAIGLARRG
jgi:dihydroorotate dehydrogenase|tara:strand:+ start:8191 stop:9303 length:1113 start_codon:yes stop_codon:yes gene_type:complete